MAYHTFHRWPKEAQEDVLQPAHKTKAGIYFRKKLYAGSKEHAISDEEWC